MDELRKRRNRNKLIEMSKELGEFYAQLEPTPPFTNMCVLDGIKLPDEQFLLQRLDSEAGRRGDFLIIRDVKYKFFQLQIDVDVREDSDFDYSDFIDMMIDQL